MMRFKSSLGLLILLSAVGHADNITEQSLEAAASVAKLEDPNVTADVFDAYQGKTLTAETSQKLKKKQDEMTRAAALQQSSEVSVIKSDVRPKLKEKPDADEDKPSALSTWFNQIGRASWYGPGFHGRKTANGETYNMHALTAAHRTLPLGTKIRVTASTGKSVILRVNDRGPYAGGRILDLSYAAAKALGIVSQGVGHVKIEALK